jgi:hypothetical protein
MLGAGSGGGREQRIEGGRVALVGPRGAGDVDDDRGEDRDQDQQDDEGERAECQLVVQEPVPKELPRRTRQRPARIDLS